MSSLHDRIGPPARPAPFFSAAEHRAIEHMELSFDMACARREERLLAQLAGLTAQTDELSTALASMTAARLRDRERLATAERWHTVYLAGLAIVTALAVWLVVTLWR